MNKRPYTLSDAAVKQRRLASQAAQAKRGIKPLRAHSVPDESESMADYVTLMGTEDVARAGSAMRQAADDMNRAAASFDESIRRHQEFMDDWLLRFNDVLVTAARNAGMA